ncbi:TM0106 family RecB-like putative nuclease [Agrobacterium tumefaciens]|uniref:TM0106 family RecB-like putative nuclease n=1 Tax=Agrobacterium tumefaciens TaxID=358 RepID=UPI00287C35BA|nr:TM0106 family RecB-like putative nuclease [Agrobacterium tumefaciens]MDS7595484.1 TM0106 family RecB-like putative nuclease [Agrobacterium tumefaciens]
MLEGTLRSRTNKIELSASDLVGFLNCNHMTNLDLKVVHGELCKPTTYDPFVDTLRERGFRHEQAFIKRLIELGLSTVTVEGVSIEDSNVAATIDAMTRGVDVIIQGALRAGQWAGRSDILRRVETPSRFGSWSYEVYDTKLAQETKGGTVLQLCLYSDLLASTQYAPPENAYVIVPWSDYTPKMYRMADYGAYYRKAKSALEMACTSGTYTSYPEPNMHCDICRWFDVCEKRRREDDHLSYVAGITTNQMVELRKIGIDTLGKLATIKLETRWKPERGTRQSFERSKEQARIQFEARSEGAQKFELLPVLPGFGLAALPEPSEGDIFFDIEGDPFVGEHGLEYLFGYSFEGAKREITHVSDWAFDRAAEKEVFERFVDFVTERLREYPQLHIYHFAPYEPAALKRLMGRYASRESEVDQLLRGQVFVDLYSVVRNSVRASVESYSLKRLEHFYEYIRAVPLRDANRALTSFQAAIELDDVASISDAEKEIIEGYNRDDCISTMSLRDWLERQRERIIANGSEVSRPSPSNGAASTDISDQQAKVAELTARLLDGIPVDPLDRNDEQQSQWVLANTLDWHRREEKATWWEYFRLAELSVEELLDEKSALSGLVFLEEIPDGNSKIPIHRYSFVPQDSDVRVGKSLQQVGGGNFGKVIDISSENGTVDIKKTKATLSVHPAAVFMHEVVQAKEQAAALIRVGDHVAAAGMSIDGPFQAARDLLLRRPPTLSSGTLLEDGESTLDAAVRIAQTMERGVLPIQGPPGTGKSHTGAKMICQFVKDGKKVGITANSHKVIRNLLDKVVEASSEIGLDLHCVQKPGSDNPEKATDRIMVAKDNPDLFGSLRSGQCHVAGATSFSWAREEAFEVLDVLFVDEAAQMSLANVLAISHAAKRLVLLGDPQQLDQPTQGTHPDGVGVSSLEHVLNGKQTIGPTQGLFLANSWRMHPSICEFNSELFYESKLSSVESCKRQVLLSDSGFSGAGLRYVPVDHGGNTSSSIEEADEIVHIVKTLMSTKAKWVDRLGREHLLSEDDILIITPYNAQVLEIQKRLPGYRVGTVDKFQGQEAPIAIYSMSTSSYTDAPRGMEFLYSANRFNVAVSRAKCLAILVASPRIFEAECKTPRQIQLANAFCRYLEKAIG